MVAASAALAQISVTSPSVGRPATVAAPGTFGGRTSPSSAAVAAGPGRGDRPSTTAASRRRAGARGLDPEPPPDHVGHGQAVDAPRRPGRRAAQASVAATVRGRVEAALEPGQVPPPRREGTVP
jgi:hypothetical protein